MTDLIISFELEEYIIEKLKIICGLNYVNLIEGILNDSKTQAGLNTNYSEWINNNSNAIQPKHKIQISVINLSNFNINNIFY